MAKRITDLDTLITKVSGVLNRDVYILDYTYCIGGEETNDEKVSEIILELDPDFSNLLKELYPDTKCIYFKKIKESKKNLEENLVLNTDNKTIEILEKKINNMIRLIGDNNKWNKFTIDENDYESFFTKKEVIIALDFPTLEKTLEFLDKFKEEKLFVKVGMELYLQNGPVVIDEIKKRGHKIFLDLKLHDIPNTVYSAAKGLAKFNIDILTVHAAGGSEMLKGAKRAMTEAGVNTKVIAITQLTSTSEEDMRKEQNIQTSIEESVLNYARLAKESGIDGVVSSVLETKKIREQSGEDFIIVNPGIRLAEDSKGDQKRVATPIDANRDGASYIVVGRSITGNENPEERYRLIKNMFELGDKYEK